MRVVVLGCGGSAAVPMIGGEDGRGDWGVCDPLESRNRRSRSSIVVEGDDGRRVLVDTSPDLRNQLLANGIGRVEAIFYTHAHADHVAGLDDVRSLNRNLGRPLQVFGTAPVLAEISDRFAYAFRPWTPPSFYRPVLLPRVIVAGQAVEIEGLRLDLFEQVHGSGTTLGFRVGDFTYSTDVVALDDAAKRVIAGSRTWIVDCFQRAPHPAHASLDLVRLWSQELGIKRTVLTHMGTDMDWAWMRDSLPPGIEAAHDGLILTL
ncbi:MBL fold metallo-hydrolase [Lichenicola cladoniae]|uniref:MBL fold metallo-hydrolase n=1 Tax=Lichenicola cladoniae TaxID=1484109 RepID=A0A6M8HQ22_9PROT|nr:MBL fold metallo-hydrolase [Lichenicola cladoniae]NPD67832.1 MBL fold metallo-hydrolase [Acetobacteraceae bacterium]QKE90438.1 MBL fold metallo-hydrolase [Lichenicola cladoniae]